MRLHFKTFCILLESGQVYRLIQRNLTFFSPGTDQPIRRRIRSILDFKDMGSGAIYLGNSLIHTRKRSREFEGIKVRVQKRLKNWQSQLLSKAGKVTLVKSVVQAIPLYSMSSFKWPLASCKALDSMIRRFL